MEKIGKKIRQLRGSMDMSADDLAAAMGREGENRKQYVYDLERGRIKRIDLDTLSKIAETFNVPLNFFLEVSPGSVKNSSTKVSIDDKTIEAGWKEKYYESVQANSELKSQIIELLKHASV